jgi:two-component system phosphate regulon response regulator OmpR
LAKPFEPRELVARIRSILRRVPPAQDPPPPAVAMGACRFDIARGELTRGDRRIKLTEAEVRLLRALAAVPGTPISREDLSAGADFNGNVRSVDVQVARLRRKIEPDPKLPRYLQTVRSHGYVLRPD